MSTPRTGFGRGYAGLAAAIGLVVLMEFSAVMILLGADWNAKACIPRCW